MRSDDPQVLGVLRVLRVQKNLGRVCSPNCFSSGGGRPGQAAAEGGACTV